MSTHLPIEQTDLFRKFEEISSTIWELVSAWKPLAQDTLGKQLVRAADSINANLVEGDGRYSIPDSLHFFVIARGSARETQLWISRAVSRGLIAAKTGEDLLEKLDHALRSLNNLITFRRNKARGVRETRVVYDAAANAGEHLLSPEHQTPNTEHLLSPEYPTPNTEHLLSPEHPEEDFDTDLTN